MSKLKLDQEEKEILEAFESGKLKPVPDAKKELERYRGYAKATMRKDARINIRLSSRDLRSLKARALQEGVPYQTLISSVLHKYVDGQFRESS